MKLEKQPQSRISGRRPTNRRRIVIAAAVVVVAIGWYLFRPELLFVSRGGR